MKTIGLLGGMTCESSAVYYQLINQMTRTRLGGIHSARTVMLSVDFAPKEKLMLDGQWDTIARQLADDALLIEKAGADFLVICTNTMHKLADQIQAKISIPILNMIDVVAAEAKKRNISVVALLGTRFTMEQNFYKDRLREKHDLNVLTPNANEIDIINRIIFEELSIGQINPKSNRAYWQIMNRLSAAGAQGIILGCTEIPLLVKESEGNIPLLDTTHIHAAAAVDFALKP